MMGNYRVCNVADPPALRSYPQAKVNVLAVCGSECFIKKIVLHHATPDKNACTRAIQDVSAVGKLRLVRIVEAANHRSCAVGQNSTAGLLKEPVRDNKLGHCNANPRVLVHDIEESLDRSANDLSIVIENEHVSPGQAWEIPVDTSEEVKVFLVRVISDAGNIREPLAPRILGSVVNEMNPIGKPL